MTSDEFIVNCPGVRQPEAFGFMNDKVYIGGYPGTFIYEFDSKKAAQKLNIGQRYSSRGHCSALIQMENGALITIDSATTVYPGYETTFEIHGEKGSIVFNDDAIKTWAFIDEKDAPPLPEKGEAVGGGKSNVNIGSYGHYELFCDLISAIKEDRPCLIPDAKTAVQVICGIYESEKTGQVLSMN